MEIVQDQIAAITRLVFYDCSNIVTFVLITVLTVDTGLLVSKYVNRLVFFSIRSLVASSKCLGTAILTTSLHSQKMEVVLNIVTRPVSLV